MRFGKGQLLALPGPKAWVMDGAEGGCLEGQGIL